jgi:hypothetical protein
MWGAETVLARRGGWAGAALRRLLGDGAVGRRWLGLRRRCRPSGTGLGGVSVGPPGERGGGAATRDAGRAVGPACYRSALSRRRPLRHSRHQLQPGHVPAFAGDGPARPWRVLAASASGLSARPARDRRRPQPRPRHQPCPGLRGSDGRRRGPCLAYRPNRVPRPARCPAHPGRPRRRPHLHGRLLLRPGLLQGDHAGPLLPRLRLGPEGGVQQPRVATAPSPLRPRGSCSGGARLHLQLSGPDLADRCRSHLAGHRARAGAVRQLGGWRGGREGRRRPRPPAPPQPRQAPPL